MIIFFSSLALGCIHDLCHQLEQRSLGAYQPFQLPYTTTNQDYDSRVVQMLERLQGEPWNMILRLEKGWLQVDWHPCKSQRELLKAFGCSR